MAKPKVNLKKPGGKSAAPRPKGKAAKLKMSWRLILTLIVAFAFLLDFSFSFVPCSSVPEFLQPLHNNVLRVRNGLIAKSGLPISRYNDSAEIPTGDAAPLKLHFAPSPKIAGALDGFIASANKTLSVCAFEIDLPDAAAELIAAAKRGVAVRVVTDTDYVSNPEVKSLLKAGIAIRQDRKRSFMHNKFIVADARRVWTGSYNFTKNCSLKNDNNALEIDSPALAACYLAKFNEYWDGLFSQDAPRSPADPDAMAGKIPLTALFSPSDGIQSRILEELKGARESVDVMAFAFTSKELAEKLKSLAAVGVKVRCLFDASQAKGEYSKDEFLRKAGVKVRLSANRSGRMHHKVIIIDGETLITGSYNYSNNAEFHNDENILIVKSPAVAAAYEDEFRRCWDGTKGY